MESLKNEKFNNFEEQEINDLGVIKGGVGPTSNPVQCLVGTGNTGVYITDGYVSDSAAGAGGGLGPIGGR